MHMPRRSFATLARLSLCALCLGAGAMPARAVDELDVKAAIVANLLAFADWPVQAAPPANGTLVLCVGERQPLRAPLATLNGRAVKQWRLQVTPLLAAEGPTRCHAIYVDDAMLAARPALKAELRSLPLLSFADAAQAVDATVCIRLDLVNGRVSFSVDLTSARANGLALSSRLLRLAREVRE
jgi:hypothetical protein